MRLLQFNRGRQLWIRDQLVLISIRPSLRPSVHQDQVSLLYNNIWFPLKNIKYIKLMLNNTIFSDP